MRQPHAVSLLATAALLGCTPGARRPAVEHLTSPGLESLNLPGTMELAPGGIEGETRQTLENIKATLERHGSSLDRVVKCTVFLADINEWPRLNEVYRTYFPTNPPARSAVAGSGLALGARVEIECIAVVGP